MQKTIMVCDHCGVEENKKNGIIVVSVPITVDRSMGPAGSMEDDVRNVDLCTHCIAVCLRDVIKKYLGYPQVRDVYSIMTKANRGLK